MMISYNWELNNLMPIILQIWDNLYVIYLQFLTKNPLGKITSRGRPEDVPKKNPDVLRTSPYGPICKAKGRICSGTSLGRTQDVNFTIIHKMSL